MTEELLFAEALELPIEARAAYLDGACVGDAELRARVEQLLHSHEYAGSFLTAPVGTDPLVTIQLTAEERRKLAEQSVALAASRRGDQEPPSVVERQAPDGRKVLYFGDYELQGEIARGAMGVVYRARQESLKRTVAIKMIRSTLLSSASEVTRFRAEAEAAASLDHPNIVPIYEVGEHFDQHYFSMKLIEGGTLRDHLERMKENPKVAAKLMSTVAGAIHSAHQRGILHRDLKPGNILMDEAGEPHVTDFGLAKQIESNSSVTLSGQIMGTPQYMAPEQAEGGGKNLTTAGDVYSLGAILYEMLCGQPPHQADSLIETLRLVAQVEPELPSKRFAKVDRDLETIAMKCLEKAPSSRYASAQGLKNDLDRWLRGEPIEARPVGAAEKLVKWMKRKPMHAAAAGLALLFLLTLGVGGPIAALQQAKLKTEADAARTIALQEKETARRALAKSQLDLAEKEFERGKFVEAQKILEETPESFRDANWRFLRAHSRDFTAELSLRGKGGVFRLQVLPQGDRFAARCHAGVIGIFTLEGKQIGDWIPQSGNLSSFLGFDGAGSRMAFPISAGEIAVQELANGKIVHRWTCEPGEIRDVLMSPDGATVLAAVGNQLIAYATQTGAVLWRQPFTFVAPALSPDGRSVAILVGRNGVALKVQILDTLTGVVRSTLEATADHPDKTALQFNPSGNQLACFGGNEVILWNPQTSAKIRALHFPGEQVDRLSPDGSTVATFSGSRIRLWDAATGQLLRTLNGAATNVLSLAFSPNGALLLSAQVSGTHGTVNVWPTRLGEDITSARPAGAQGSRVLFDRDGSKFFASARTAGAWDSRSGVEKWRWPTAAPNLLDLAIHPIDGSILVSEFAKPVFTHLSSRGEMLEPFGTAFYSGLKFNRSGGLLLAVDNAYDQSDPGAAFSVLEYPSGKVLRKIPRWDPRQPFAAFCLSDAAVATAARAGGITVWDWKANSMLRQIAAAQTGSIGCLAASPDGRHLATGGPDRWIRVWGADTGQMESAFRAHWEGVHCVTFSSDGRELLSGSDDGTVRINDAVTGEERLAFYGLNSRVMDVDFSPDGALIAAITSDGFTKVWDRKLSSADIMLQKQPSSAPASLKPPTDALTFAGHRYQLVKEKLPWDKAKDKAEAMGGHLASITSQEENDWIMSNFASKLKRTEADRDGDRCFIGATRGSAPTASWAWITGEPLTIQPWMGNFPNDNYGGGKIATLMGTAWDDVNLNMPPIPFLVEWDDDSPAKAAGSAAASTPAPAVDGWQDLLASLTPELAAQTGQGWKLVAGALECPSGKFVMVSFPGTFAGSSYQVRVKLRKLAATDGNFHVVLPVADRMTGWDLDGMANTRVGMNSVDGQGKEVRGSVEGPQIKDTEPHDLDVIVRLEGENARITTTLDARLLYEWTGPIGAVRQTPVWATTPPGSLAFGVHFGRWNISEVKAKRMNEAK